MNNYPANHAVVRHDYVKNRTIVFFPFMTTRPGFCPTITLKDGVSTAGHHGMRVFDSTRPANASPEALAVLNALQGSKSTRINGQMHHAIVNGVPTGDTKEST
jgi:hypothetical protein